MGGMCDIRIARSLKGGRALSIKTRHGGKAPRNRGAMGDACRAIRQGGGDAFWRSRMSHATGPGGPPVKPGSRTPTGKRSGPFAGVQQGSDNRRRADAHGGADKRLAANGTRGIARFRLRRCRFGSGGACVLRRFFDLAHDLLVYATFWRQREEGGLVEARNLSLPCNEKAGGGQGFCPRLARKA